MKTWLACLLVISTAGCPDINKDANEPSGGPTVEFDPANAILPFPNNLVIDPATGKVNLPAQACETPAAMAVRVGVLNKLDGFGTFEVALQVPLTEAADPASIAANVVLFKRASGTTPVDPSMAQAIPLIAVPGTTLRFDASDCTMPAMVATINVVPMIPLDQKSTYTYAVLDGLKTTTGDSFLPSFTWSLVRQATDPVMVDDQGNIVSERTPLVPGGDANNNGVPDVDELRGLDQLWKAHAQAMAFLAAAGHDNASVLVAADFTTQTTTDPLDPMVAGSPAAAVPTTAIGFMFSVPGQAGVTPLQFLQSVLPAGTCNAIPCNAVGDIFGGRISNISYQVPGPNTLPGGQMIPGPWSDPVHPAVADPSATLDFLAVIPATPPPAGGYPLVVFGHGLGSSKESAAVFAPQLAAAGFASIAIDFQAHGSRAVRTSIDPYLGCAGTCATAGTACDGFMVNCAATDQCVNEASQPISPTVTPQCYAPFLSPDLATTRDNIRQTVLDLQRVIAAAKACGAGGCTAAATTNKLNVDASKVVYAGISLGGIIGSTTTAVTDLKAAVLNVPGVGWLDILENTANLTIRCTLVNSLIDAGILMGTKWDGSPQSTALCTTDAWKAQPGFQQFRVTARWVLDPADGANFTKKLATKRILIQEVVDDQVVPNVATDNEGMLVGLAPLTADPMTVPDSQMTPPPASAAIVQPPMSSKWLRYPSLPADPAMGFPGNAFQHASLLQPAPSTPAAAGQLGTLRVQTDAITWLFLNK